MATGQEISDLRVMINELTNETYTDFVLSERIDSASSLQSLASAIWREKAGRYSELVDIQEGASRRSLGSLHSQALKMASHYENLGDDGAPITSIRASNTRQITRP